MRTVEVFADVCCPFTHVGLRRLRDAREQRGAEARIVVRAWPLELVNGRPLDPMFVAEEVDALRSTVAGDLFAAFDPDRFPTTSLPAFGLTVAGYRRDPAVGEAAALRLRAALFEEGRDIGDTDVVAELAAELGLGVPPADDVDAAVRADWDNGRSRGVLGSPHFFVGSGEGWFCPSLAIERDADGRLLVAVDRTALDRFLVEALGA